jgi:hypothetical protein
MRIDNYNLFSFLFTLDKRAFGRNKKHFSWLFIIIFLFVFETWLQQSHSFAQEINKKLPVSENSKNPILKDSLKNDSTKIIPKDTIPPNVPLFRHGSIFVLPGMNYKTIRKEDIQFQNYNSFFDIIKLNTPSYPLALDGIGTSRQLSFFGSQPRDVSIQFNNRPIKDLEYGSLNPEQLPTEFMEEAEVLVGSDAVIFSDNSSGALINIQEIRYNTKEPYTKLWYSQAGYDFISADGTYSQNWIKNWNFTFGFRTMSATGRYSNSWLGSWNVRGIVRWNPSDLTSISLVENFTNHGIGTNGGVNLSTSQNIYDNIAANVIYNNLNERVFRHDLTLSMTSLLSKDSLAAVSGTLFFSHSLWDNYVRVIYVNPADTVNIISHISSYFGATVKYEQKFFNYFKLRVGGEAEYDRLEKTYYFDSLNQLSASAYAQGQLTPVENLNLSGGMRLSTFAGKIAVATGAKAVLALFKPYEKNEVDSLSHFTEGGLMGFNEPGRYPLELIGDLSVSERFPTPAEGLKLNKERNFLAIAELRYLSSQSSGGGYKLSLGAFERNTNSPILTQIVTVDSTSSYQCYNATSRNVIGAYLNFETRLFKNVDISLWLQAYSSRTNGALDKRFPDFIGGISGYYEIIAGESVMRLCTSIGVIGPLSGEQYLPIGRNYLPVNTQSNLTPINLDVFAEAKLGVAYVKITYENILSQGYYFFPYYPQLDRNFRLSISWPFLN